MGFEKFHIFAQNPKVLAYGFSENCQFRAKTDRNSVFLGCDPRIANTLSIMVPYFNFYEFWKISHFCSKSKAVSLQFYRKLSVWGKNRSKLHISVSWPPYYESVIHNGTVFQFLRVLKKFNIFARNPKVLAYGFTKNCQSGGKNRSKLHISWSRPQYCKSVIYNFLIFQFLRVLKNFTFLQEIQRC
jgi:hypothetical protein